MSQMLATYTRVPVCECHEESYHDPSWHSRARARVHSHTRTILHIVRRRLRNDMGIERCPKYVGLGRHAEQ